MDEIFWMKSLDVSLSAITFLDENFLMWSLSGMTFLDEMSGCRHFLGKCLNVVTFSDEISWMNVLMLRFLGCLG